MKINVEKCEVVHLGYNNLRYDYSLGGATLSAKSECKDLGIVISDDTKMRKHCTVIIRNASFRLKQFRIAFSCTDNDFQLYMYKTYIRPLLEYNSQIWSPHLLSDIDMIENVQRSFTRSLWGMGGKSYLQRLVHLNLQSLEVRRIFNDLVLFHKIVHGNIDLDTNDFVTFKQLNLRGHDYKVHVDTARIDYRKYSFVSRTSKIWNQLPAPTVNVKTSYEFKKKLSEMNLDVHCRGRTILAHLR